MTWEEEVEKIERVAHSLGIDPLFVAAIRKAEGGRDGREFGVLSVPAPDYNSQLRICCNTVKNFLAAYDTNPFSVIMSKGAIKRLIYSGNFIASFARKWAPIGAENDPRNLNRNWFTNVTNWYSKFVAQGLLP